MPLDLLAQLLAPLPTPSGPPSAPHGTCPADMVLVQGTHHEQVQRLCTVFRQDHCWDYYPGAVALEMRETPVHACMDRYEWPNRKGELPVVMARFIEAEALCAGVGKRLCTEFEWELACEGPTALPFPYGHRQDPAACNVSKPWKAVSERKLASNDPAVRNAETARLWQGEPLGSFPGCVSAFGVHDLVGNVEEWVATSRAEWPYRSSLKGGYWSKPWAGCRGTNESHGPLFRFYEVGFRCCQEPT
ncbi:formylglycine-generating enzyme family protein [Chondromyces apiculatus]|uniref:Branched-chain acyl-CoA dehydrogenase n=1 Tax=Chondromyces apiculatus DSM 436 TaxID=1192034 RepID=A0A017THT4_9BACT|nr:SUMF1/EgtB/PvdO family nonheme iron enzyme [Chondromyces apiculatus]EYF08452.1 Branched-chain acyl-CoA dehydrogenase [Chondromyces apiculatus DSM 436]